MSSLNAIVALIKTRTGYLLSITSELGDRIELPVPRDTAEEMIDYAGFPVEERDHE